MKNAKIYDCIIIGGGPAGLLATLYLARFRRDVLLIDGKCSRASLIPQSHNYPGFPKGIAGKAIIKNLKNQLSSYKFKQVADCIVGIKKNRTIFTLKSVENEYRTKKIIIATGLTDIQPDLSNLNKKIRNSIIRHCMICDGYEVINKKIAVLGWDQHAFNELVFLTNFTRRITFITLNHNLSIKPADKQFLIKNKIPVITKPIQNVKLSRGKIQFCFDYTALTFDSMYSALGATPNSQLVISLGAKLSKDKFILTNKNQQSSISGLYAVGDVCKGLAQIAVGFGQAIIAATHIHNSLLKE